MKRDPSNWSNPQPNKTAFNLPKEGDKGGELTVRNDKKLLTPDEFRAAHYNAIGRMSIYDLLRAGKIRHLKIGRKILIPASEVEAFLERETESAQ